MCWNSSMVAANKGSSIHPSIQPTKKKQNCLHIIYWSIFNASIIHPSIYSSWHHPSTLLFIHPFIIKCFLNNISIIHPSIIHASIIQQPIFASSMYPSMHQSSNLKSIHLVRHLYIHKPDYLLSIYSSSIPPFIKLNVSWLSIYPLILPFTYNPSFSDPSVHYQRLSIPPSIHPSSNLSLLSIHSFTNLSIYYCFSHTLTQKPNSPLMATHNMQSSRGCYCLCV